VWFLRHDIMEYILETPSPADVFSRQFYPSQSSTGTPLNVTLAQHTHILRHSSPAMWRISLDLAINRSSFRHVPML
jgi:hypothetical protein